MAHIGLFFTAIGLLAISTIFFSCRREGVALFTLFLCALALRLFMVYQDAFLHEWDEQFHALVARNMMDNPLKPVLKSIGLTGYDPFCWSNSHVWLHKQPLFLWQMALSMKVFGVSEFAIRYPAALMGALMVVMLFSITKTVTESRRTAFAAAVIFCFSGFQLELISGQRGMDHNDVAFGFYVLASLWAYVCYCRDKRVLYAMLIGLFAGCAVLNKWLTGLVVFAPWVINMLLAARGGRRKREILHVVLALAICTLVFVPWQVYIFQAFPVEARFEYDYNVKHLSEVVEGHEGSNFYYIDHFAEYFGEIGWFLLPAGFVLLLPSVRKRSSVHREAGVALVAVFVIIFFFFSYMVRSKLSAYFFVAAPVGVAFIAVAVRELYGQFSRGGYKQSGAVVLGMLVVVICVSALNPELIIKEHNPKDKGRVARAAQTRLYKRMRSMLPGGTKVMLNAHNMEDIQVMFYNKGVDAYVGLVANDKIDSLQNAGATIAAFAAGPLPELPVSLMRYRNLCLVARDDSRY